jgi:hypothetical protein
LSRLTETFLLVSAARALRASQLRQVLTLWRHRS